MIFLSMTSFEEALKRAVQNALAHVDVVEHPSEIELTLKLKDPESTHVIYVRMVDGFDKYKITNEHSDIEYTELEDLTLEEDL